MVKIKVDGVEYEVDEKKGLISALKDVNIHIPHFCYHPKLPVVGMCRMCLIEIEGLPKVHIACNTQIKEGLSIITKSERVEQTREGTLEFLLANHPLDCPTCDKSGECILQNNSFSAGKGQSRFEYQKRNVPTEEIGDNLMINHNRCIICYRCVSFEENYVQESNLGLFERGYHSVIGLAKDEPISHNYQGALSDLCPVGALLNHKTLFKSRVWWYKEADSICPGCSTGCNIKTNVRDNQMYRYMPRINEENDMYFICDKGRFDIDWLNKNRLWTYLKGGLPSESSIVFDEITNHLYNNSNVAVIGGGKETNENLECILEYFSEIDNCVFESRVSKEQYEPTKQIDFLMTNDYRPNTKGSLDLSFYSKGGIDFILESCKKGDIKILFVLNEKLPDDLPASLTTVVLDTNLTVSAKNADYAVPIQVFAEQVGSFTNKNGLKQKFEKSLNPMKGLYSSGDFFKRLLMEMKVLKTGKLVVGM